MKKNLRNIEVNKLYLKLFYSSYYCLINFLYDIRNLFEENFLQKTILDFEQMQFSYSAKKSLSYTIPKRLHMIFLFSVGGHVEVVLKDWVGLNRSPHGPGTCHTERERYYVLVNWYSVLY